MDKKLKLKTELAKKLKKETTGTGTGASVTPGIDAGVATKYAFGKRGNKGTPSDWKDAPSIPNRKSKAMDYKKLWEIERDQEVKITSGIHAGKTAIVHDFDSEKDIASGDDWVDVLIGSKKEKKTVKASELKPLQETEDNLEEAKENNIEEILTHADYEKAVAFLKKIKDTNSRLYQAILGVMVDIYPHDLEKELGKDIAAAGLNEGYAQFRNETKQRSKPDQFHQAVKQVKKKMSEINRLFEYMDRLKTELSEGEDLKYKKYTENALQQIKENAKSLFLKSTKLK